MKTKFSQSGMHTPLPPSLGYVPMIYYVYNNT